MRASLRQKIWLLNAGIVALFSTLLLITTAYLVNRENEREVRRNVRATGAMLEHLIRERKARLMEQANLFAQVPILKACVQTGDSATVSDCANDYRQRWEVDYVLAVDRDGESIGSSGVLPSHNEEARLQTGIESALEGEDWSGIIATDKGLMLVVFVPVRVGQEPWGAFGVFSGVDSSVAYELRRATGAEVAFAHDGRVLASTLPQVSQIPTPRNTPQIVQLNNEPYFALYEPLPSVPPENALGYVVLSSYHKSMAMFYRFRLALLGVFGIALTLALLLGAVLSGRMTRSLNAVVQAARSLQQGEWPGKLPAQSSDEIGLLERVFNEMTEGLKTSQERLMAMIDIDPLTEVDNHRRFHERLIQEVKRCEQSEEPLSLLIANIDEFQKYNQREGYATGDDALRKMADCLRRHAPEWAILGRFSGDQFAVLLPACAIEETEALAETLRQAFEQESGGLTLSIGCAEYGLHSRQADGFVMAAELASSLAKQLGRNRVCRFDSFPGADANADPYQLYQFFQDGSLATIQALAAAVDAKDAYTQGHSQRVAQYACDLASYIGMAESEIELLRITGTLHDVGKIGVPDSILKKPAQLDEEERKVMETHPVLGEAIVAKAPQLTATLPGVRHHHEKYDGTGYPDGLAGEAIPLMARLLAIADTYDAMTSDRPYRKGLPAEVALSTIEKGAGTQFDPVLAPAFVAMMRARDEQKAA